jgi:hypothetical protein
LISLQKLFPQFATARVTRSNRGASGSPVHPPRPRSANLRRPRPSPRPYGPCWSPSRPRRQSGNPAVKVAHKARLDPQAEENRGACDQRRVRAELVAQRTAEARTLAGLQVERAKADGERQLVEADLGPVRYLAALLGAGDHDVLRYFILVVALLLDPAAVLLLLAAASARRRA